MNQTKINFLQNDIIHRLKNLETNTKGKWGVMNAQQMVEHVAAFFKISTEKIKFPLVTPTEHLEKFKAFLLSDKEFKENTKAPKEIIGDEPLPLQHSSMKGAIDELENEIKTFFEYFKHHPLKKTLHPVFGELNFSEWVQLHHKHVTHHFKQFGLLN